jgi:hypothetical protein
MPACRVLSQYGQSIVVMMRGELPRSVSGCYLEKVAGGGTEVHTVMTVWSGRYQVYQLPFPPKASAPLYLDLP